MGFILLLVLIFVPLLIFSFLIGLLPLLFLDRVKHYKQRFIQLSIGILLSTIFVIIIPEGLDVLGENNQKDIGIYIILGFIVVYVIEENIHSLTGKHNGKPGGQSLTSYHQLGNLKLTWKLMLNSKVTFPLFVHGLSDGLTLGFVTVIENKKISVVIILATIIHKIPAIISLVLILSLKENLNKVETLANLWWFALSTPLGYLFTAIVLKVSGLKGDGISGKFLIGSAGSLIFALIQTFQDEKQINYSGGAGSVAGFDLDDTYSFELEDERDEGRCESVRVKIGMFLLGCSIPWMISQAIPE